MHNINKMKQEKKNPADQRLRSHWLALGNYTLVLSLDHNIPLDMFTVVKAKCTHTSSRIIWVHVYWLN